MSATKPRPPFERVAELLRAAASLAGHEDVRWLLVCCDDVAGLPRRVRGEARKKLLLAVSNDVLRGVAQESGCQAVTIPTYSHDRLARIKLALMAAFSTGLVQPRDQLACLTGPTPTSDDLDTLLVLLVGEERLAMSGQWADLRTLAAELPVSLLEAVLDLAVAIGQEGYEGRPTGTIVVLGDSTAVMEKSRQLIMNPLQGYGEAERNIMDPNLRQALKSFAILDGATVVREDGVVLASGRYLDAGAGSDIGPGLGGRHQAAAGITAQTRALAVAVSQTSGDVRVFKSGQLRLHLQPANRRTLASAGPDPRGAP